MEERKIEILESTQKGIIRWLIKQTFKKRFITQDNGVSIRLMRYIEVSKVLLLPIFWVPKKKKEEKRKYKNKKLFI
jgi:hypothetical protein